MPEKYLSIDIIFQIASETSISIAWYQSDWIGYQTGNKWVLGQF